jgi:hypothetical protein
LEEKNPTVSEMVEVKLELATEKAELDALEHVAEKLQNRITILLTAIRKQRRETKKLRRHLMDETRDMLSEIQDYRETIDIFSHETDLIDSKSEKLETLIIILRRNKLRSDERRNSARSVMLLPNELLDDDVADDEGDSVAKPKTPRPRRRRRNSLLPLRW